MRGGLLQEAMHHLSITELWKRRGWTGVPGKSCHFPNDAGRKKAACSIFAATTGRHAGCQLLKDHKRGVTWDAPGLLAEVEGLTIKEACRIFVALSGVKPLDCPTAGRSANRRHSAPPINPAVLPREEAPKPHPFDFRVLNPRDLDADEIEAIATSRGVSARSVESLAKWGVIHAVTLSPDLKLPIPREARPLNAWALHCPSWGSFRLRPYIGQFPGFDGQGHKSLTPAGASCSNPVWIGPEHSERVLVVEGEGDAIGAVEIIRRERNPVGLAIVCVFSSSIGIPSPFLHRFERRRVRITPHVGDSKHQGEIAAIKWAASLKPWAAEVHIFSLAGITMPDGREVGDLGDLAQCQDDILQRCGGVTTW
jgi:hypothetical protein